MTDTTASRLPPQTTVCPRCRVAATGYAQIEKIFGFRMMNGKQVSQSYCRADRNLHAKEMRQKERDEQARLAQAELERLAKLPKQPPAPVELPPILDYVSGTSKPGDLVRIGTSLYLVLPDDGGVRFCSQTGK